MHHMQPGQLVFMHHAAFTILDQSILQSHRIRSYWLIFQVSTRVPIRKYALASPCNQWIF